MSEKNSRSVFALCEPAGKSEQSRDSLGKSLEIETRSWTSERHYCTLPCSTVKHSGQLVVKFSALISMMFNYRHNEICQAAKDWERRAGFIACSPSRPLLISTSRFIIKAV